jgi:hypothetical protein
MRSHVDENNVYRWAAMLLGQLESLTNVKAAATESRARSA